MAQIRVCTLMAAVVDGQGTGPPRPELRVESDDGRARCDDVFEPREKDGVFGIVVFRSVDDGVEELSDEGAEGLVEPLVERGAREGSAGLVAVQGVRTAQDR